ncbi:hypothetical protein CONLIGDRAFT_98254 [Coniochaeta ligniaria NRRL 30616]|uniref:Uncharacterized protein n=1 Tax=Coniochaeta ligniaria NRRL 30616 TaxID=1408157 RepID=A0A1J7JA89_9PEZI|nr:hypothetical protein CONLIGDRAFT_98254 [Coniochaeta ligniaria NRRL 30616]
MNPSKLPLLLHALLETAAALSFVLTPAAQLPGASPEARLILRSYGGLLLSSSILCLGFFLRPGFDSAARLVAGSMAVYHFFPIGRACVRLRRGRAEGGRVLGGPAVHLVVHLVAVVGLGLSAVYGRDGL